MMTGAEKAKEQRKLCNQLADVYEMKNEAYGDSFGKSVQKYGPIAALTRMSDKFNRIEALMLGANNRVVDERLEDTLIDIANYALMTVLELRILEQQAIDFGNGKG